MSFSKIADTRPVQYQVKQTDIANTGLVFGPALQTKINPFFDFKTALLFSEKGMIRKAEHMTCNVSGVANSRFSYIEVPLLLSYEINAQRFEFGIDLGPSVGYWMGGYQKGEIVVNNDPYSFKQSFDLVDEISEVNEYIIQIKKEDVNRFDISLNAGGEAKFLMKHIYAGISFRYVHGTISYVKRMQNNDPLMHHRSVYIALNAGFRF